jgi:hypothetical protein
VGPNGMAGTFSLTVSPHALGLRVVVHGESTYENTVGYWRALLPEVQKRHPKCLLLIDELRGSPLTVVQWQALVESMKGSGLEAVRIAHVKPLGLQLIEHCEIYAREAGFDSRVFAEEAQAELWLRHGER